MIHLKESMVNSPHEFSAELLKDSLQREVFGYGRSGSAPFCRLESNSGMPRSFHQPTHLCRGDTKSSCANAFFSILVWQLATKSLKALASAVLDQVFGDPFSPGGSILLSRLFGIEDRDVRSRPILLKLASRLTSPCS